MAMTFKSCKSCNDCDDLLKEIERRLHSTEPGGNKGLVTRIMQQVYGCQTPDDTISPHPSCAGRQLQGTWEGHNTAISDKHRNLKKAVDDWDKNNCGNRVRNKADAASVVGEAKGYVGQKVGDLEVPRGGYKGPPAPSKFSTPPEPTPEPERRWPEMPPVPPMILPRPPGSLRQPGLRGGGGGGGSLVIPQLQTLM